MDQGSSVGCPKGKCRIASGARTATPGYETAGRRQDAVDGLLSEAARKRFTLCEHFALTRLGHRRPPDIFHSTFSDDFLSGWDGFLATFRSFGGRHAAMRVHWRCCWRGSRRSASDRREPAVSILPRAALSCTNVPLPYHRNGCSTRDCSDNLGRKLLSSVRGFRRRPRRRTRTFQDQVGGRDEDIDQT
jgi:hypothetical protein